MTTSHVSENKIRKTDGISSVTTVKVCCMMNIVFAHPASFLFIYRFICLFGNSMLIFPWGTLCTSNFFKIVSIHMSVEHLTQLNQSDFFLKMFVLSDLRIESIWHFSLITKMTWRESSSVPIPCSLKVSSSLRGLSLPNLYIVSINCFYCCYSLCFLPP